MDLVTENVTFVAILSSGKTVKYKTLTLYDCHVDLQKRTSTIGEKVKKLSEQEANLLLYLAENPERIIPRDELLKNVWKISGTAASRVVAQAVKQLRKKIGESATEPKMLFSIYGQGYKFVLPVQPAPPPPPKALSNIEESPVPIIGRRKEVADIIDFFTNKGRLLTLLATGGMGKTTLSKEYAFRAREEYKYIGGIYFCDLVETRTELDIYHTIADVFQIQFPPSDDLAELSNAIGEHINNCGQCLVILDNFEQIEEFSQQTVGKWFHQSQQAHFIVTSRQRLGLITEYVYELPPLNLPEAINFFIERAKSLRASYQPAAEDKVVIKDIVEKLDRIPLAIQLAASRSRLLTPQQIYQRLSNRFKLLRRGPRVQAQRQETMRAAIDWSWDLLNDNERNTLIQCSVFRGGFRLDAAEEIIELDGDLWLEDVLQSLVDKSMLIIQHISSRTEQNQGNRISVFDNIRYYAMEKLQETEVARKVTERHSKYYLNWIKNKGQLTDPNALYHMSYEVDNLQIAWQRLVEKEPDQAAEILLPLTKFYEVKGWYAALLQMTRENSEQPQLSKNNKDELRYAIVRALYRLQNYTKLEAMLQNLDDISNPQLRNRTKLVLGNLYLIQQKYDQAETLVQQIISTQEYREQAASWMILSGAYAQQYRYAESLESSRHVLKIFQANDSKFAEAVAKGNLGSDLLLSGHLTESIEVLHEALELNKSFQNRLHIALNSLNLSSAYLRLHSPETSLTHSTKAIAILQEQGQTNMEAMGYVNLALAHQMRNAPLDAARNLQLARQKSNDPEWQSIAELLLFATNAINGKSYDRSVWEKGIQTVRNESQLSAELWDGIEQQLHTLYQTTQLDPKQDAFAIRQKKSQVSRFIRQEQVQLLRQFKEQPKGHKTHDMFVMLLEREMGENYWKRFQQK